MPLILHEYIDNGEIGIWKISENPEELVLLARLSVPDKINFSEISALHRRKEWLATRALLNELITDPGLIKHWKDGRPYLENGQFNISISHTLGFVAIMLHATSIPGIDIELISRQVGKVANRFLSNEELLACCDKTGFSNRHLLLHWCAKEAIFKMVPFENIEYSTDIRIIINDITDDSGSFLGVFDTRHSKVSFTLYYKLIDEVLIVWGWVDRTTFNTQ